MLQPQSLGYRETTSSKMFMLFVEGGSQSVSCLGHFRGQFVRAEVILQFDDVWLWWQCQPTDLCRSLSFLAGFHAVGHNTCGWIKAVPYKEHWRPEHSQGRVVVSFQAQHWWDLQHDSTSSCMQVMVSPFALMVRVHLWTVLNKVLALSL